MITIRTNHGEYRGRTAHSIVRREYGRTASILWSADPNSPNAGHIVRQGSYGGWIVLATLYTV